MMRSRKRIIPGKKWSLVMSLTLLFGFSGHSQLTTLNIPVSKDAYTDSYTANTNYGSDTTMRTGTFNDGGEAMYQRSFVYFNLDTIPAGKQIYSAKIKLRYTDSIANSPSWRTKLVTSFWYEDSITSNNEPTISNDAADVSSTYSTPGDTLVLNVTYTAKNIYNQFSDNYGWCVQVLDETDTTLTGATFYSQESATYEPFLEIVYYEPLGLQNVEITHESTDGADDAVISLQVTGGSEDYTYTWRNSTGTTISTDTILDSIGYGWYGLQVTGTYSEEMYQAFLVGIDCDTVDISFKASGNYTRHAVVVDAINGGGVDLSGLNYGNNRMWRTWEWYAYGMWTEIFSYTSFNIWMDPRFTVQKADLELQGLNHSSAYRTNEAEFLSVTENWDEEVITFNNQPASDTTVKVFCDSTTTATQDRTVDIIDFWNYWKNNNALNYGMKFQLELYDEVNARQRYHSPNATSEANLPVIEFTLDLVQSTPNHCYNATYAKLQRKLSGVKYPTELDYLYFYHDNEYASASANLDYQIFSNGNRVSPVMSGTTDVLTLSFGANQYKLDVSSLTTGEVYLLEVVNDKGEKRYLRFEKD